MAHQGYRIMTMKATEIERSVLKRISPSKKDRQHLTTVIADLQDHVEQELAKRALDASVELVGSTAKDTFLKTKLDIDLFVIFPPRMKKQVMAQHVLAIGRLLLSDTEECYAEHPYLRGTYRGFKTELVPCYRIDDASQKLSAVDRTPLHTRYIISRLTQEERKEVRLLKQFLRGIGCYGAEAEIEGFSGYLCELLILYYTTFHDLLNDACHWKPGTQLTLLDEQIASFDSPLIFIDPVDSERNVSSALSQEKFSLFVEASQAYLEHPQITFFFPHKIRPWSLDNIQHHLSTQTSKFVGVVFAKPAIIAENLYPQVRKALRSVQQACSQYGFSILDSQYYVDDQQNRVFLLFQIEEGKLSETYKHMGPPLRKSKHAEDFLQKWEHNPLLVKGPYKEKDRWYVELRRTYRTIQEFLEREVKTLPMGKHLDGIIQQGYQIVKQDDLLVEELRCFWTQYFARKKPWEW
jgi:tRNA nucleotidyltransferase (CCA-adding enzyme)